MDQHKYKIIFMIVALCVIATGRLIAQVLPVGLPVLEERYRREQLLGRLDSNISFAVRPLHQQALQRKNIYDPDSVLVRDRSAITILGGEGMLQLMPVVWQNQYTSAYPYGWNDGAMIPSRGLQTMFSAGVYASYKFISVQFRPEFVTAQNRAYTGFDGKTEPSWKAWYQWANNIDMPERFGDNSYNKAFWGQSFVKFNFEPLVIGLSTENIWWGPSKRNALLMSNTAPGFAHLTLNTTRPIRTPIGSFEGQLIAGRLQASGFFPTPQGNPDHYDKYYEPKRDDWRYLSGIILSYQPKWVPGLSFGLIRSFIRYHNDGGSSLNNIFPLLGSSSDRFNTEDPDRPTDAETEKMRDQYSSVFGRWAFPKGKAEIYAEYGRNAPAWNSRDLAVELEHSRAYVIGFTKLVPLRGAKQDLLQLNLEFTQLERSRTAQVRQSPTWYVSDIVKHGYTNLGQVLGAGIGPGSNLQSFSIDWVRGMKQIGIQLERLVHQNDFYYDASGDIRRNWVDISGAVNGVWDYKNFIFTGSLTYMHAYNYQYEIGESTLDKGEFWNFERLDKNNFQLRIGMIYRF